MAVIQALEREVRRHEECVMEVRKGNFLLYDDGKGLEAKVPGH
jgi:hypothetical protein